MVRSRLPFIQGPIKVPCGSSSHQCSVGKFPTARPGPVDSQHASRVWNLIRATGKRGLLVELLGCEQSLRNGNKTQPFVWLTGTKNAV